MNKFLTKTLLFLITIFLLSACAAPITKNSPTSFEPQASLVDHQLVTATVGNRTDLQLEVVNTSQSIAAGLSGRDELGADGMLFVFAQPQQPVFWMKEMKFALDLIWIRNQQIVEITANVSPPDPQTPLSELVRYSPQEAIEMVLEVPAGFAARSGWMVGDLVEIK